MTGHPIPVVHRPAADEPQTLIADTARAAEVLGWKPARSSLGRVIRDAWEYRSG